MPSLNALRLHNGTVYRWNRPCYGIMNNVPHLRIENRVIPSGPTVLDEVANAAFFFGMMAGMIASVDDVRKLLTFADVKSNFLAAARDGIRAQMNWFNDTHLPAKQLVLEQLLPLAREGLQESGIDQDDIDRYLGVLEDRVTHAPDRRPLGAGITGRNERARYSRTSACAAWWARWSSSRSAANRSANGNWRVTGRNRTGATAIAPSGSS